MKGILVQADLIPAIVEGRKTVTRRAEAGLKVINQDPDKWHLTNRKSIWALGCFIFEDGNSEIAIKPRYSVGEVVYIKEVWRPYSEKEVRIEYKLDGEIIDYPKEPEFSFYACGNSWRPPLFLKAKFARYFAQILDNRPERLQEITVEDAIKEGIHEGSSWIASPRDNFAALWDSTNAKRGYSWDSNHWVFRYEFKYLPEYKGGS